MKRPTIARTSALAALALLTVAGCGGKSSSPDGGKPGTDAAAEHSLPPGGCQCTTDTQTLTIAWDCYCALHDCKNTEPQYGCETGVGTWTRGCAFDEYTADTPGGPEIFSFDSTGQLVGAQLATDTSVFACPDNSALQRFLLRSGQFRPDTCNGVNSCTCANLDAGQPCTGAI